MKTPPRPTGQPSTVPCRTTDPVPGQEVCPPTGSRTWMLTFVDADDVAGLAGSPGYLNLTSSGTWFGGGGTSLASPLYAGAFASIRTMLHARRIAPPVLLNDALCSIAANLILYNRVFVDVKHGNNDIYGVNCCKAKKGFDLASGLGELQIDKMADALAAYAAAQHNHHHATRRSPPMR